jgi:hypothetical protein
LAAAFTTALVTDFSGALVATGFVATDFSAATTFATSVMDSLSI